MRPLARTLISVLVVIGIAGNTGGGLRADPVTDRENELRSVESAFAKTMADRSHEAFVDFLSDDVVFASGGTILRGREAVADAWLPFYESAEAPFSWEPETVVVVESGGLGLTSGPVLDPDGNVIGIFNSVWRVEADGKWRIVFDRGCDCSLE